MPAMKVRMEQIRQEHKDPRAQAPVMHKLLLFAINKGGGQPIG